VQQIRWAIGFGVAAALAAAFGAAIFAVWGDGQQTGTAAAERTLRDGRVLVWVGFATAAGFVLAGRDRLTSEVDRLFEEDRRVWTRRVGLERDAAYRRDELGQPGEPGERDGVPGGDPRRIPGLDFDTERGSPRPYDPSIAGGDGIGGTSSSPGSAPRRSGVSGRPPTYQPAPRPVTSPVRRGPSGRLLAAGGVLAGAGTGAGLGALIGELAPGAVLGVVAGLLVGLLLDRGDG